MDEIVRIVAEKTGFPEDQVRTVVGVAVAEIKHRLPSAIAGQLDTVLTNGNAANIAQQAETLIGGFLQPKE